MLQPLGALAAPQFWRSAGPSASCSARLAPCRVLAARSTACAPVSAVAPAPLSCIATAPACSHPSSAEVTPHSGCPLSLSSRAAPRRQVHDDGRILHAHEEAHCLHRKARLICQPFWRQRWRAARSFSAVDIWHALTLLRWAREHLASLVREMTDQRFWRWPCTNMRLSREIEQHLQHVEIALFRATVCRVGTTGRLV